MKVNAKVQGYGFKKFCPITLACITSFYFASLMLFKTFLLQTHVSKYMHVPCCGTGGILRSVEIHVQIK